MIGLVVLIVISGDHRLHPDRHLQQPGTTARSRRQCLVRHRCTAEAPLRPDPQPGRNREGICRAREGHLREHREIPQRGHGCNLSGRKERGGRPADTKHYVDCWQLRRPIPSCRPRNSSSRCKALSTDWKTRFRMRAVITTPSCATSIPRSRASPATLSPACSISSRDSSSILRTQRSGNRWQLSSKSGSWHLALSTWPKPLHPARA